MTPRILLHLEGAAVFVLSILAYRCNHGSWLLFVLLLLVPDVSMLGYIHSVRVGAFTYNAIHTYLGPLILGAFTYKASNQMGLALSFIWLAHIGMDRMLGYGLKYSTNFKDTHLSPARHSC